MLLNKAYNWKYSDLLELIHNNMTEYKYLEYKSLDALTPFEKAEISKDVSSFANSGGGIIVYGIKEVKNGERIELLLEDGLELNTRYSKEWLENIIFSNISPRIKGIFINPVKTPREKYIYVVIIPQSDTAHMAANNRYYKRHNFKAEPMEDYEVREIINRQGQARLQPLFTVPRKTNGQAAVELTILLRNTGNIFIRHFALELFVPETLIAEPIIKSGRKQFRNNVSYREYLRQSDFEQYVFPHFHTFLSSDFLPLLSISRLLENPNSALKWTIYTDKGRPQKGSTSIQTITRNRLLAE